jgi:radical SAM superfamily enzyme YgiQ (UPF0313 family)
MGDAWPQGIPASVLAISGSQPSIPSFQQIALRILLVPLGLAREDWSVLPRREPSMPHVAFVPFTGFRIREAEMLELGMSLPGLQPRAQAIAQLPALGLLTLAGMTPAPWTCSYHEASSWNQELVERILEEHPDVVAISALTASVEEAYQFSAALRRERVRVVLGGLHATACSEEARQHADAVVIGEGEPVWPRILADALAGNLQPVYQSRTPFDLGQSPLPRFDLLTGRRPPRFTLQTQRGCPLACEFCGASRLLGSFREKPLANVSRELAAIAKIRPEPLLELADDNTFAGPRAFAPLLEKLADSGARYFTEVDWRIGTRPDLLNALAASGCVQVLVGIESLVYKHGGMGPKFAEWSRIQDALLAIQDAGVAVIGCFIVGADGETRQSLDRLEQMILDTELADVQITIQTPFPGTALFRRLQKQNRLLPERGWPFYTLFDVTYRPDAMSVEELERGFQNLVRHVFAAPAATRRNAIRKRIWSANPRLRQWAFDLSAAI